MELPARRATAAATRDPSKDVTMIPMTVIGRPAALLLAATLTLGGGLGLAVWLRPDPRPAPTDAGADAEAPGALPAPDPTRIRVAVDRGLQYLRRFQDPASGGWIEDVGYKFNDHYNVTQAQKPHVGVTSLALMAFLAGGHLPGRGEHAEVVERGTNFILGCVDPETGYISAHGTRMYSHAFATLFLAEIFGMTHRDDVKEKLQLAVDLTVESQNKHGSWRYHPYAPDSDMSITVCQIMALRAARNIGIRVPKSTIDRAYEYVKRSAYRDPSDPEYGGFKYQEQRRSRTSCTLTAAGIATLNHSGIYQHQLIQAGIDYLKRNLRSFSNRRFGHYFFWYGHYYASQVFFLAADDDPALWQEFYWPMISRMLVERQQPDGSWQNHTGPGRAFSTAVASIILQIPNEFLPIFHR